MNSSILSIAPWFLTTFIIGGIYITTAVILLKERHFSAWLMLAGSCISLLGQIGSMAISFNLMNSGKPNFEFIIAISGFSYLGALLFAIGLLLHALHLRGKSNRIQELEAILASLQERGAHAPSRVE